MKYKYTFTIITCTINKFEKLIRLIKSLKNQSYRNFELIIISSDHSDEFRLGLFNLFPDNRIIIITPLLKGLTNALNFGIEKSSGEIIIIMDSDDISANNRISYIVDVFNKNSNATLVFSNYQFIDEYGNLIPNKRKIYYKLLSTRNLLPFRCIIAHPTVAITRKNYLSYSGYSFGAYCEDYDLWLRMRRDKNSVFVYIDLPLLKYRKHGSQLTSNLNLKKIFSYNLSLKFRELMFTGDLIFIPAIMFTIFDYVYLKFHNFLRSSLTK